MIKKKLPDAEMHIFGAYPSEKVNQLNNPKEGFLVKGRVRNVEDRADAYRLPPYPLVLQQDCGLGGQGTFDNH